jgi:hypothetical protein
MALGVWVDPLPGLRPPGMTKPLVPDHLIRSSTLT